MRTVAKPPILTVAGFLLLVSVTSATLWAAHPVDEPGKGSKFGEHMWTAQELRLMEGLSLRKLPPPPIDPSNSYSANRLAAEFGRTLFFDSRFSGNGDISCASCHDPELYFTDEKSTAVGLGRTNRRTPTLVGVGYQSWFFWDGRKDSLWSQALGPLEAPAEHGISRTRVAQLIKEVYLDEYERIFAPIPESLDIEHYPQNARPSTTDTQANLSWSQIPKDNRTAINRIFTNVGKAIAAYERKIVPGFSRFDAYVDAALANDYETMKKHLSPAQARGLKIFLGKGGCIHCHNGPLLTNGHFHRINIQPTEISRSALGRASAISLVRNDEFNCLGEYSDADPSECGELRFLEDSPAVNAGAFKTPPLRGVASQAYFMHAGQSSSLLDLLQRYQSAAKYAETSPELEHDTLSDADLYELTLFLGALAAPHVIWSEASTWPDERVVEPRM